MANLSVGLLVDILAAQMPVIEVDNTHFSLNGAGERVPTVAVIPNQLLMLGAPAALGPYGADVPDTELVRPRHKKVLPTKYEESFVHRDGVAPAVSNRVPTRSLGTAWPALPVEAPARWPPSLQ